MEDVRTMVLVPVTLEALKIPVLVAGGISDGNGSLAALTLGCLGWSLARGSLLLKSVHYTLR